MPPACPLFRLGNLTTPAPRRKACLVQARSRPVASLAALGRLASAGAGPGGRRRLARRMHRRRQDAGLPGDAAAVPRARRGNCCYRCWCARRPMPRPAAAGDSASARAQPHRAGAAQGGQWSGGEPADPDLHQYRLLRLDDRGRSALSRHALAARNSRSRVRTPTRSRSSCRCRCSVLGWRSTRCGGKHVDIAAVCRPSSRTLSPSRG